jgi:hypothetical protein
MLRLAAAKFSPAVPPPDLLSALGEDDVFREKLGRMPAKVVTACNWYTKQKA